MDSFSSFVAGTAGAGVTLIWNHSSLFAPIKKILVIFFGRLLEKSRNYAIPIVPFLLSFLVKLLGCTCCPAVCFGWIFGILLCSGWGILAAGPIAYLIICYGPERIQKDESDY
jgi:hypothetical protein